MPTTAATDIEAALTDRIGEAPLVPAETDLGHGIAAYAYWNKQPAIEIVLAQSDGEPSDAAVRGAHKTRLNKRSIPLVLVVSWSGGDVVIGTGGDPVPVARIDANLIVGDLASAIGQDPLDVPALIAKAVDQAHGTGALTGVRNHGLFSSHFLERRAPRYGEWDSMQSVGASARKAKSLDARLTALGFSADKRKDNVFLLSSDERPAAAIFAFSAGADLDRVLSDGELPVTELLREMQSTRVKWGILSAGDVWRLYYADGTSPADSYVEIALDKLTSPAYFGLLFSAAALTDDGIASRVLEDSQEFATGLSARLRDRIYGSVVPTLVKTIATSAEAQGRTFETRDDYRVVYDATLTLLYRLLFILYAESRRYLPVDTNNLYRTHSLGALIEQQRDAVRANVTLDDNSHDVWTDLGQIFNAIATGNGSWGVPAYNGGLFATGATEPHLKLLDEIKLGDAGLVEALINLAVDEQGDEVGRIDFSDLDIRRLGDIYEGLLSFEVDRATEDLTLDTSVDVFRPAAAGETVEVPTGTIYVRTRGGGRKASGSFYTPQFIVRHLVEQALVPALEDHLAKVTALIREGKDDQAERLLWEFRVVDPAMGSGHFLVDALDVITTHLLRWLGDNPLPPLRSTLEQLREVVAKTMRDAGGYERDLVKDPDLLRRVVLKRCIYGVDHNKMAVQLARLALWLDAFVPGLPLSYLDHNLQHGNSLIGVIGSEVVDAIAGDDENGPLDLFSSRVSDAVDDALRKASDAFSRVERNLDDVHHAQDGDKLLAGELAGLRALYDAWTSEAFGNSGVRDAITNITSGDAIASIDALAAAIGRERVDAAQAASEHHSYLHWPLAFPEVFRGNRPGFDVVLANPPWEKIKPEKHNYYALYAPGLRGVRDASERDRLMKVMDDAGSPAGAAYESAVLEYAGIREYFSTRGANYKLGGSGDIDLFKAFAERFISIVRSEGSIGAVLPRMLLVGAGTASLRETYLRRTRLVSLDVLRNQRRWAFANVKETYTIVCLAATKSPGGTDKLLVAGPLTSRDDFESVQERRVETPVASLEAWSDKLEIPMLPSSRHGEVFWKMAETSVFAGDHTWRVTPYAELHESGDRRLFSSKVFEGAWELWKGESFDLYSASPDSPAFWIDPQTTVARLQEKRLRSRSSWDGLSSEDLADTKTLPIHDFRIAFRDVTAPVDTRTTRCALIPPHVALGHTAPFLIWKQGSRVDQAYLLGVLSSIPFDWFSRRLVDKHLTYSVLNLIPTPDVSGEARASIARNAARLSCQDERYVEFANAVGVKFGPIDADAASRLKAENDALVALAYDLSRDDLEFMFTDFTERAAPPEYRALVLDLYDEWSGK